MISTLGVRIELKGERPKAKLKLVITTDDETSEHKIEKIEPIRWSGKLYDYTPLYSCVLTEIE